MKKSILLIAAMFAAFTVNAGEVTVDLSKYTPAGDNATDISANLADGVLTVSYNFTGDWGNGGVEFALDNLDVTNMAFDYKGDAAATEWVSFQVYLKDSKGGMWYSAAADLSISEWNAEWENKSYMPSDILWESSTAAAPEKPFVALGFLANPEHATAATFAIRNVKLTVEGEGGGAEALTNVAAANKAVKVLRNGQVLFVRGNKTFNALGAEVK